MPESELNLSCELQDRLRGCISVAGIEVGAIAGASSSAIKWDVPASVDDSSEAMGGLCVSLIVERLIFLVRLFPSLLVGIS